VPAANDPYKNAREEFKQRKSKYLNAVVAPVDDDSTAKRRNYLKRPGRVSESQAREDGLLW